MTRNDEHAATPEAGREGSRPRFGSSLGGRGADETEPLDNQVRRLAFKFFRDWEAGDDGLAELGTRAKAFLDEALIARAHSFSNELGSAVDWGRRVATQLAFLDRADFETAKAALETTRAGIVFTAHPTFAMSSAMNEAFLAVASARNDREAAAAAARVAAAPHAPDKAISLAEEHDLALTAVRRAGSAIRALTEAILEWARDRHPERWTELVPQPISVATWVGYDLDGRTDIHWGETFRLRLEEKAAQLAYYAGRLRALADAAGDGKLDALAARLADAGDLASEQAAGFAGDLDDPKVVVAAANRLTGADPRRLIALEPVIEEMSAAIVDCADDERRLALCVLRSEMKTCGLGRARIHLRVNAAQVRSTLRADLGIGAGKAFIDRSALDSAAEKAGAAKRRRINLASVFLEKMTARRQLMLCAEFLKHIDADTPIRFLIAECEAPATVMGAVYLARLYGVDKRLDISPLFETPDAIERGGRFIERLLAEPEYLDYIRARGRLAVQIGFSDAGRFMGQVAANLAIERLQILISRALADANIRDLEVVVFNTHGESMGRGGYFGALCDRFDYLMTPWARARYAHDGLRLNAETSFQGGDGFLHFETQPFADRAVSALAEWAFAAPHAAMSSDAYYAQLNYSWDVYRGVKRWQEALFENENYQRALGAFAPNLLYPTGSRKAVRQSGAVTSGPRALRAIPHNAILQQLAIPANVCGGVGDAAGRETDRMIEHIANSGRMRQIIGLAREARCVTSLDVLRAYGFLFDAGFWIARAGAREADSEACAEIAHRLSDLEVTTAINRLANHLASDVLRFDELIDETGLNEKPPQRCAQREALLSVHAIRQAMIMRGFVLVAGTPGFSQRHDVSRARLFELAFALRFGEVADLLEEIFPSEERDLEAFAGLEEESDDLERRLRGYPHIHEGIIEPLRRIEGALREITAGVSHFYGAFG